MSFYGIAGTVTTVLSFLVFLGIVAWAYGSGRKRAFEEAANAPFALEDEVAAVGADSGNATERRS